MQPVVNLIDVKSYLNITTTANDSELAGFLSDAIDAVADVIGPIAPTAFTDVFDSHNYSIVLPRTPVLTVDSVVIQPWLGAAPVDDTAAWLLNPTTGILRRALVTGSLPFYGRGSVFTVTYTAGRLSVPGPVNRAILIQVGEMWKTQRGAMTPASTGEPPLPSYGGAVGFLSPGVMELLTPYLPPPGVA